MGSTPIARSTLRQRQATQGYEIGVKTLIRWESLGKSTLRSDGLMASRIPALPRDSHVQSHAAVHKNKLCDSHAALVARAIAMAGLDPTRSAASALRRQRPCCWRLLTDRRAGAPSWTSFGQGQSHYGQLKGCSGWPKTNPSSDKNTPRTLAID